MSVFSAAEINYLQTQPLMRFASASTNGRPDVAPAIAAATRLGATTVGEVFEEPTNWFQVMNDVERNEFCFILRKTC